jgi:lipoate-protein ligase B
MLERYFGKISFDEALRLEAAAFARVGAGGADEILAFETGPVVTLGVRALPEDLLWSEKELAQKGFEIRKLRRGGQATLHNPGQLVIFPIADIRRLGARAWVQLLLDVTARTLRAYGKEARCRKGQPGLYTAEGKIAAVGLRVQKGVSTHGISINVANDLADFAAIRACGVAGAPLDRVGNGAAPEAVFFSWLKNFKDELTTPRNLTNLECSSSDVRL